MFSDDLAHRASRALEAARAAQYRIVTAETCTAGLVAACLTSIPGASSVFERGFVLYHDSAKATGLGVDEKISKAHGAVSAAVTEGLALGALQHSSAGVSVAVTGYAGPGGGTSENPVGTCFVAAATAAQGVLSERHVFSGDRNAVRLAAVGAALDLIVRRLG